MKKQVIIVAGGEGKRMESDIPKQFIVVAGKPVLMHTIEKFRDFSSEMAITVVLPEPYIELWQSLCLKYRFGIEHNLAKGGSTRFHSVKNGLVKVKDKCIVAIHDGVRPLVSKETLERVFACAEKNGNAIPVIPVNESLRKIKHDERTKPVKREKYFLVQTPQCFRSETLLKAYEQEYRKHFTDDASVVEALGEKIHTVEGNEENIKLTRPFDLKVAGVLLGETVK
jgi:2-C-methyl-D-erythritol 4-phosphate cytidylyltransferase